ncbi:hypothetical protein FCF24_00035 [Lacticaseibacillus paracasei]|nr:hypothetical protein FCF24_00035 [Lacticaseibacillus paracasei]
MLVPKRAKGRRNLRVRTLSSSDQSAGHYCSRPRTLRFLSASFCALKKYTPRLLEGCGHGTTLFFSLP